MAEHYLIAAGEFPTLLPLQMFGAPRSGHPHKGIDLARNNEQFPFYDFKPGLLLKRAYNTESGYSVWVDHKDNTRSLFCHMTPGSYARLKDKTQVDAGQDIGIAGNTGNATANVLHYEYHVGGVAIDPYPIISQNYEMIEIYGKLQAVGSPQLIKADHTKDGTTASYNELLSIDAMRESTIPTSAGKYEFRISKNKYWIHVNDSKMLTLNVGTVLMKSDSLDSEAAAKLNEIDKIIHT